MIWLQCSRCNADLYFPLEMTFDALKQELEDHQCWPATAKLSGRIEATVQ